jgi:hypothetical protein
MTKRVRNGIKARAASKRGLTLGALRIVERVEAQQAVRAERIARREAAWLAQGATEERAGVEARAGKWPAGWFDAAQPQGGV